METIHSNITVEPYLSNPTVMQNASLECSWAASHVHRPPSLLGLSTEITWLTWEVEMVSALYSRNITKLYFWPWQPKGYGRQQPSMIRNKIQTLKQLKKWCPLRTGHKWHPLQYSTPSKTLKDMVLCLLFPMYLRLLVCLLWHQNSELKPLN